MSIVCPYCAKQISELARSCPHCRGDIEAWETGQPAREWTPAVEAKQSWRGPDYFWAALGAGVVGGVFSGLGFAINETAGIVVAAAAGTLANILLGIGIVAKGVEAGTRAARR